MITIPSGRWVDTIATHFGEEAVVARAAEEAVEAGDALLHYHRALRGEGDVETCREHVVEEIADVLIMFAQLASWDTTLRADVKHMANEKLHRTLSKYDIAAPADGDLG